MTKNKHKHTFHIPVMGLGFTIDSPIKIAHLGISSVISIVDDNLIEKIRKFYTEKSNIIFKPISTKIHDYRAKRITEYLNLVDDIVKRKFDEFKLNLLEKREELEKYIATLPNFSEIKKEFLNLSGNNYLKTVREWIDENVTAGSIDVNIMTKLDKANYIKSEKMPIEFNDAHASLRGFANSKLESSLILSAGLNPRLYSYIQKFEDFYPNENAQLKKKIILKVSDYRSALIQGKFLAKKGIWVSEYRVESGLNCGGHAFASDGYLMGPILEEFKNKRVELIETIHKILVESLKSKQRPFPAKPLNLRVTAQGGVGTAEEHKFLLNYYEVDAVGWGTPFLLVPEATSLDEKTVELLSKATEKDLYLSKISPLGVPFNSVRNNTKDIEKEELAKNGKPGSPCPKKYLTFNTEFTEIPICSASRQFQNRKIEELNAMELSSSEKSERYNKIIDKACLCVGLSTSALTQKGIATKVDGEAVSVCPGPNMAYFSETISLSKMVDHIYGRANIILRNDRPNMFIKELTIYVKYLKDKISDTQKPLSDKQLKYFLLFQSNLFDGIKYYKELFFNFKSKIVNIKSDVSSELDLIEKDLLSIDLKGLYRLVAEG